MTRLGLGLLYPGQLLAPPGSGAGGERGAKIKLDNEHLNFTVEIPPELSAHFSR